MSDPLKELGETRPSRLRGAIVLLVLTRINEKGLERERACGDTMSAAVEPDPEVTPTSTDLDWWEKPYAGGPMVKVDGFPRPLYPPDGANKGKVPSTDGPDVIAYKRTVSRLGRWPWDPPSWDDSYSNGFAHGKSGNVGQTGVAGVQRQQSIEDTGWIGEKTFNTLRSAKVPTGPNIGQMAMDGVAVNLVNDAFARFHGGEPSGTAVEQAITDFCVRSIKAAAQWHYAQVRPMRFGAPPDDGSHDDDDCSEHATQAYYWARQKTGIMVPDPNGNGYNGYGWTGELVQNPEVDAPFKVGDLAIYGNGRGDTEHVCTCYLAGDAYSSEWCSNGSESAPYAVELYYRSDLVCVVRPGLAP